MPANIPQTQLLLMAGINPKTGLPFRINEENKTFSGIKDILSIMDEQTAVNRFKWGLLPVQLTSQELERFVYQKGQLALFYLKELEEFFILPFALSGTLDAYGRYNYIRPVPLSSGARDEGKSPLAEYLSKKVFKVVHDVLLEAPTIEQLENSAVILWDYSKQTSENIISRQVINSPLIESMAELIPYMQTTLLKGTGVEGVKVGSAEEYVNVEEMACGIKQAARAGKPYVAVQGKDAVDMQELAAGNPIKAEEYMLAFQALDNIRLSTYGIKNGGVFEKKAHMLEAEANMNTPSVDVIFQDSLNQRIRFCNIANSIWDLDMYVEPSEAILKADINGDGVAYDRQQVTDTEGEKNNASDTKL